MTLGQRWHRLCIRQSNVRYGVKPADDLWPNPFGRQLLAIDAGNEERSLCGGFCAITV